MLVDVRRRAEERLSELSREYFQHHAGLKAEIAMAPIVGKYADLLAPEVVTDIRNAWTAAADPELKQQLGYLYGDCLRNVLRRELAPLQDTMGAAEAKATVKVGDETLSYPQASIALSRAATREERKKIASATRQVTHELNANRLAALKLEHKLVGKELGFESYQAFYSMVRGIDFGGMVPMLEKFLADTQAMYDPMLATWAKEVLDVPVAELESHDMAVLRRAKGFDAHFPQDKLVSALHETLDRMGLPADSLSNITMDLDNRPGKSSRAFCMGVRIPQEIYLCITPTGGADDYQALMHETGHALHFGHAEASMPFEFRFMGDNSVCEAFAFNLEHITLETAWLTGTMGMAADEAEAFRRYMYRILLFDLRRFAAKHLFELELHDDRPVSGKGAIYEEKLTKAVGVKYFAEDFLAATDGGYYTAQYFRAWCLEAQLKAVLKREFGEAWFQNPASGQFMQQLWSNGQRLPGDALARHLGYEDGITPDALLAELHAVLG